jgi:hypothetical protein
MFLDARDGIGEKNNDSIPERSKSRINFSIDLSSLSFPFFITK